MSVEGLYSQTSSHIPNTQTLVSTTTNEKVGKWLPHQSIYTISVTTILLPEFNSMQIKKFNCTIRGTRQYEITSIVEFTFPKWTSRYVLKGVSYS